MEMFSLAYLKITPKSDGQSLTPMLDRLLDDYPGLLDTLGDGFERVKDKDVILGAGDPSFVALQVALNDEADLSLLRDLAPVFKLLEVLLARYCPDDLQISFMVEFNGETVLDLQNFDSQ